MYSSYTCRIPNCRYPLIFKGFEWSTTCGRCNALQLSPCGYQNKYVEGKCGSTPKIYRLSRDSGWFTCKCCNVEFIVDNNKSYKFGNENIFCSERTLLMGNKLEAELEKLNKMWEEINMECKDLNMMKTTIDKMKERLKALMDANEKMKQLVENAELEKAATENKELKREILALSDEIGEANLKSGDFESQMLEQLKEELKELKNNLEINTKLKETLIDEYNTFCEDVSIKMTENEESKKLIHALEAETAKLATKIDPNYTQLLSSEDISKTQDDYDKDIQRKEAKNEKMAQWLESVFEEIQKMTNEFDLIKKETEEKWKDILELVKEEENELKTAEEKRRENMEQRLQYLEIGRSLFLKKEI